MNASHQSSLIGPPRFVGALVAGFNVTAGHIYLLILPICLDLLLWFGPHFRLKTLYAPILEELFRSPATTSLDAATATAMRSFFGFVFDHFNLLSLLSAAPVGIPSLMMGTQPVKTPLGSPSFFEIAGWSQAASGWILFTLLGIVLGCLYFGMIARATTHSTERFQLSRLVWETLQILGMLLFFLAALFLLSIPFGLMIALFQLVSPGLSRIGLLLGLFMILWILLPLIFTPHGIFAAGKNAFRAMLISGRLVRALFPGVALFLLSAIILAQGLGLLWHLAPEDSWLMLAGIFGNAFIGTGLLAASFVYYRGAAAWAMSVRKETPNIRIQV
jgi:hypothetical protein